MIAVLGAGAFGTALAVTQSRAGRDVVLWGRDVSDIGAANSRLPGVGLPTAVKVTSNPGDVRGADIVLLAVPMAALSSVATALGDKVDGKPVVACCKGLDPATGLGPAALVRKLLLNSRAALLSGPSFASDIAAGLPTALTLAGAPELQPRLSTRALRLYTTMDIIGVEIGGAVKNVIAIACGAAMGAGLGESARAALMTRGFAEMRRLARHFGAHPETLMGLSGVGDLVLTCTSGQSRNFRFGEALGKGVPFDPKITVEGRRSAEAILALKLDLPICEQVAAISSGKVSVTEAIQTLLSRPERAE